MQMVDGDGPPLFRQIQRRGATKTVQNAIWISIVILCIIVPPIVVLMTR